MNIGIVGAGATGLSAAYYLSKKGHRVTVFEAEDTLGGIASSMDVGSTRLERLYHHIFTGDDEIIALVEQLGLSEKLRWYRPRNGIYANDKQYPFTTALDLVRFSPIPFPQRIRLGLLVLKSRHIKDWRRFEHISAKELIKKRAGKSAYEELWAPLLKSKFDKDAEEVSAAWLLNKFRLRGSSRDKFAGQEMLGYMEGSFHVLYDELQKRILLSGGKVLTKNTVSAILPCPDRQLRVITQNEVMSFDKVIVTTAPQIFLSIAGSHLSASYRERLSKISYMANICMMLELSEPLSKYYWITVSQKDYPFVLLIEHTSLVPHQGYRSHIVYLSRYLDENNRLFTAKDNEISSLFIEHVQKMFPDFNPGSINGTHIFRTRFAQPVAVRNYSRILPGFATPIENLYLACMAQIYPEDRGQNHAVRMGKEIAAYVERK